MTIASAFLTSEGVVLGADSATSVRIDKQSGVAQILNHAQKVFALGPIGNARVGLLTWGDGALAGKSHRTIAARIADQIAASTTVKQVSDIAIEAVGAALNGQTARFGYFIGGWDAETHDPKCFRLAWDGSTGAPNVTELPVGGARFEGVPDLFIRAYQGFDPALAEHLLGGLKAKIGAAVPNLDEVFLAALGEAVKKIPHGGLMDLPIREAIDFVHMYLHLTIKAHKFRFGPPVCGGPIEIGFISTDRPFRWARHKRFDSAIVHEEVGELWQF